MDRGGVLVPYTPIGGTHQWGDAVEWYDCHSEFAFFMTANGFRCRRRKGPFWSGALGGIPLYKTRVWAFGADVLTDWMIHTFPDVNDRHVLSVSHGGQVAMMAAAAGLELASLVTITMPVRSDMEETYRQALPRIGVYTHVYSDSWWRDRWQLLGTLADGQFRFRRTMPQHIMDGHRAKNIGIKGVGHTDLVKECKSLLSRHGILDRLRAM